MFMFLTNVLDTWKFIVNLKITATAAVIVALTDTDPPGSLPIFSLFNPVLSMLLIDNISHLISNYVKRGEIFYFIFTFIYNIFRIQVEINDTSMSLIIDLYRISDKIKMSWWLITSALSSIRFWVLLCA